MYKEDKLNEIEETKKLWEDKISQKEGTRVRSSKSTTALQLSPKAVYTPTDLEGLDYLQDCGFPGEYPYLRGIHPKMYRDRIWSTAQYAGFGTPQETNRRFRFLLEQGQTGLSVACDLPTQLGYDPDYPLAEAEVGVIGVSVPSLKEMELMFKDIPLDKIGVRGSINAPHIVYWSMFMAAAEKQGVSVDKLSGTIVSDCLQEYLARGNYIFPPRHAMRLSLDTIEYCLKNVPKMNFLISVNSIREAGGTLIQEAAYSMAIAIAFIEAALARGIDVDQFASRISFNYSVQMNFFEEIAKFRALRRLWARIVKERFGAKEPSSCLFRVGPGTSGAKLTTQEPENNIIRVTLEGLSAILGGVQYLHTSSFDEGHAIPTEKAVKIALRTQQIIAYETGVPEVIDPLGGSYYVEALTNQVENEILDYLQKIDAKGGIISAIESGWAQGEIAESAYRFQKELDEGQRIVVGVNKFVSGEKTNIQIHQVNHNVVNDMKERVALLRETRDSDAVKQNLSNLRQVSLSNENLMPYVIKAVKEYATMGEICDVLRESFGIYREKIGLI